LAVRTLLTNLPRHLTTISTSIAAVLMSPLHDKQHVGAPGWLGSVLATPAWTHRRPPDHTWEGPSRLILR